MRVLPAVLLLLVLTACSDSDDNGDDTTPQEPTQSATEQPEPPPASETATTEPAENSEPPEPKPKPGTEIVIGDSAYGPMLFDKRGQAIYLFDVEKTSRPRCYGDCAVAWPPVLTDGEPVAGDGVRSRLLGTTERRDGSTQVTYGGHPLYFYVNEGPGEVECHDVFLNGGYWYVVTPGGDRAA